MMKDNGMIEAVLALDAINKKPPISEQEIEQKAQELTAGISEAVIAALQEVRL